LKKLISNILIIILIFHLVFTFNLLLICGNAATEEIDPEFGNAPVIDGYINKTKNEWNEAEKVKFNLYSNESTTDVGLPITLWVMQNDSNLYISVKFDLISHNTREFIGILISKSASESTEDFFDAKIVQFSDLGGNNEKLEYLDYNLKNDVFIKDQKSNGNGFAQLEDISIIYEFKIPLNNSEDKEDIFLDYGESYSFKIIYGATSSHSYPAGILKSNIVLINIQYPPVPPLPPIYDLVLLILSIIIFSVLGALFGFYVYNIFILKKKVERINI